jgi:hypothetical protein
VTISVLHRAISKYWAPFSATANCRNSQLLRQLHRHWERSEAIQGPQHAAPGLLRRKGSSQRRSMVVFAFPESTFLFLGFALSRRDGEAERLRCGSSAEVAHGRPRGRLPDLVGSRLPRPYHFRARIQSFQAVAAPFTGDATAKLLFGGCGISPVAVKTNDFGIKLEFLASPGCWGARRVSRARWIGISEATSSDASTYLAFPKDKSRKDRRRRSREIPPRARRPTPPSRAASAGVCLEAGANDLGGTLMRPWRNSSGRSGASRNSGARWTARLGQSGRAASLNAADLAPVVLTPPTKRRVSSLRAAASGRVPSFG